MLRQTLAATVVSRRYGYAFLGSPKCGNTTIKALLWRAEHRAGGCPPLDDEIYVHARQVDADSPFLSYYDTPDFGDVLMQPGRLIFTIVRNPYDRVVASYLGVTDQPYAQTYLPRLDLPAEPRPSLVAFLSAVRAQKWKRRDMHWMPLSTLLAPDEIAYDVILRTESLLDDFAGLLPRLIPDATVDDLRLGAQSAPARAAVRFTPEAVNLVQDIYGRDFELFGYDPDPGERLAALEDAVGD
jgi:hypothetical protein